jgi:hypothetical protein
MSKKLQNTFILLLTLMVASASKVSAQELEPTQVIRQIWEKLRSSTYETTVRARGKRVVVKRSYLPSDVEMSFCYQDKNSLDKIYGMVGPESAPINDVGFDIASVSKIFTTHYVLKALAVKKNPELSSIINISPMNLIQDVFKTTFAVVGKDTLVIDGSYDPLFGTDNFIAAMQSLKQQMQKAKIAYAPIKKIYYKNFIQLPVPTTSSSYEIESVATGTIGGIESKVPQYIKYMSKRRILAGYFSSDLTVDHLSVFPPELSQFRSTLSVTKNLTDILKYINSMSNNPGADLLFTMLGNFSSKANIIKSYYQFFSKDLSLGARTWGEYLDHEDLQKGYTQNVPFAFYSGSGLPTGFEPTDEFIEQMNDLSEKELSNVAADETAKGYKRNKASCSIIFNTFNKVAEFSFWKLDTFLPVNGVDGTLKRMISPSLPAKSFVGKTGTLNNLLTLGGAFRLVDGNYRYFFLSFHRPNQEANAFASSASTTFVRTILSPKILTELHQYYGGTTPFTNVASVDENQEMSHKRRGLSTSLVDAATATIPDTNI